MAGKCVTTCPSNSTAIVSTDSRTFLKNVICQSCSANCTICTAGVCQTCSNQTYYLNGICIPSCANGYFVNAQGGSCAACSDNCAKCTSLFNCTQCSDTANFIIARGVCLPKCKIYNSCSSTCDSSCAACYGNLSTQCISCSNSAFFLQNYKCVSSCDSGYFPLDIQICMKCSFPCSNCVSAQACTSCMSNYFLYGVQCLR
jgi:proprotein convertase subtilisin/kexin type 5